MDNNPLFGESKNDAQGLLKTFDFTMTMQRRYTFAMKRLLLPLALLLCSMMQAGPALPDETIQINKMCWCPASEVYGKQFGNEMGLGIWYTLNSLKPSSAKLTFGNHTSVAQAGKWTPSGVLWFGGITPDIKTAQLHIEWLDPKAPEGADGNFQEIHEFKDVPLPSEREKPLDIAGPGFTSKMGTRIAIEKVIIKNPDPKLNILAPGGTWFIVHVEPTWQAPDLRQYFFSTNDAVIDDRGKTFIAPHQLDHWGFDRLERRYNFHTFYGNGVPAAGAKSCTFTINLHEQADSLRKPEWYRHANAQLDLSTVPAPLPPAPIKPLATAQSGGVTATIEAIDTDDFEQGVQLWLHSAHPKPGLTYLIKKFRMVDQDGKDIRDSTSNLPSHINGTPALPGEKGFNLAVNYQQTNRNAAPPRFITLEITARPVRSMHHAVEFHNVPIPASGTESEPNLTATDSDGARLVLRKVGYFTAEHRPPGLSSSYNELYPPSGLAPCAVVLQPKISRDHTLRVTDENHEMAMYCDWAQDDRGRNLAERHNGAIVTYGDPFSTDKNAQSPRETWCSPFLLPPAPGAKTFSMRYRIAQLTPAGRELTFTLKNVPVPATSK